MSVAALPTPMPVDEICAPVSFGNLHWEMFLDASFNDPITQTFAAGGFWIPYLCDLMLQLVKPGDRVLDLGAHLGTMSLTAAAAGCQVVSIEASPRNAALLQLSVERNQFHQMRVVHAAAGAVSSMVEFIPHGPWGVIATDITNAPAIFNRRDVLTRVVAVDELLDEVGWDRADFVKIDIEGSEISALRGMKKLLSRDDAPTVLYECNASGLNYYNQTVTQLKAELERYGYANYLVEPDGVLRPVKKDDVQPEYNVDYLATRTPPTGLAGWRIGPPLTRAEIIARLLGSIATADANQLAHLKCLLGNAWLLCDQQVQRLAANFEVESAPSVPPMDAPQRPDVVGCESQCA